MDQRDLLRKVLEAFDTVGIKYILVGSVASAVYGEPRLTLDIDVVAALTVSQLPKFLSSFPPPLNFTSPPPPPQGRSVKRNSSTSSILPPD